MSSRGNQGEWCGDNAKHSGWQEAAGDSGLRMGMGDTGVRLELGAGPRISQCQHQHNRGGACANWCRVYPVCTCLRRVCTCRCTHCRDRVTLGVCFGPTPMSPARCPAQLTAGTPHHTAVLQSEGFEQVRALVRSP